MTKKNDAYGFETRAIHAGAQPDPGHGCAEHADLSDQRLCVRRCRSRGLALQPPNLRLHLHAPHQSDRGGPRGACSQSRGRARGGCVRDRSRRAAPRLLLPHGARRRVHLLALSLWRLDHPVRPYLQEVRLARPPCRSARSRQFRRALTPKCKAIFAEQLTNPGGVVVDLEAIAKIAHEAGIPFIVDNTIGSPYLSRPLQWGADIVDPFDDQIPRRARHVDGRHRRRIGQVRLGDRTTSSRP